MPYWLKYNVADHLYIPMIKRGVVDFAVGADWTPAAGDVKYSKDGASPTNAGTLPSAVTSGNGAFWDFTFTGGELSAKKIQVTVVDSATKAVEDQMFDIFTYGNASAQYVGIDLADSVRLGLTALPNAAAGANGGLPTGDANNSVKIQGNIKKNTAFAAFMFLMTDSTNHNPVTGKTVTVTRSIDGGAFGAGTLGSVTEVANGWYKVDFAAADLNGNNIVLRATATGADDTEVQIFTNV